MKKRKVFLATSLLLMVAICASASTHTIENPIYMSLNADAVNIKRVEFGKKHTTLYFHIKQKEGYSFQFRSSTYIVDEVGNRYKARSSYGFQLGEWTRIGKEGFMDVSILFDALPDGTRVFDCIEGPDLTMSFQFYGIREKGQNWDVFTRKEMADTPFKESFFHIDTAYVTGRIIQSKYDRLKPAVHEILSNSQQNLLRQYRENHGALDYFHIAKDGNFSFQTIVAKPCMDNLNINGTRIPVLLVPGDHLHVEISHLNEYNQRVTFKSELEDCSRMLTNTPFIYDSELADPRGTLIFSSADTLSAESWKLLHEKQERCLEICHYLSAKYQFTPTEQKLMQMSVRTTNASISILRMQAPIFNKRRKEWDEETFGGFRRTIQELQKDGIYLDFSFLKECPWDDPVVSATTSYESIPRHLRNLVKHIQFSPDARQFDSPYDSLNLCAATENLGVGDMLMLSYMMEGKKRNAEEYARLPHLRTLLEAAVVCEANVREENYPVNQTVAADVVKKLVAPHLDRKVVLMPINWYKKEALGEIDSLYRANRMEMEREAVLLPVTTSKLFSKKKLKELQREYPLLENTISLKYEDFLLLNSAFQFQPAIKAERVILPNGTYDTSAQSFYNKYKQ